MDSIFLKKDESTDNEEEDVWMVIDDDSEVALLEPESLLDANKFAQIQSDMFHSVC